MKGAVIRVERDLAANQLNMKVALQNSKVVCFGRFLINVPQSSTVVFDRMRVPYLTELLLGEANNFEKIIANRLVKIDEDKIYAEGELRTNESMVGWVLDGEVAGQKIVFGVGKASGSFYSVQSFLKLNGDIFLQEAEVHGSGRQYNEVVAALKSTAKLMRPLRDDEIPAESGLCLDHAFMAEPKEAIREAFGIGIRLKEFPDVHFSISTTKKDRIVESDALEPRLLQTERDAIRAGHGDWYASIKTLRRGKRSLGKWDGFEVLAFKPKQAGSVAAHEFVFVSQGEPNNPLLPVLEIEMHTGMRGNRAGAVRPSLSDEEAVMLWDAVTKSIRVREVGAHSSAKPVVPLAVVECGTLAIAGKPCPKSGWWEHADADGYRIVDGGRQYFRIGEHVPQATLFGSRTLVDIAKGRNATFERTEDAQWKYLGDQASTKHQPGLRIIGFMQRAQK